MNDFMQEITLYHKTDENINIYYLKAFLQGTSILNRNRSGIENTDKYLLIIFDYNNDKYEISKDDVIVNKNVATKIEDNDAPLTELQELYGEENVFKVKSIDEFRYNNMDDMNHIEVGLV